MNQKARLIDEGAITIVMDNKVVWRISHRLMEIANHFNQDSVAEYKAIIWLKDETIIDINIDKVYSHWELKTTF